MPPAKAPCAARSAPHRALLLLLLSCCTAAQPPPAPAAAATNWASLSLGATATASSAGYWCVHAGFVACTSIRPALRADALAARRAGYTAEPQFALDDDVTSFWSSTGGAVRTALNQAPRRPNRRPNWRPAQVCCTESNPAWLLVSLGALRPVATLQVVHAQDLTFTVALANASTGPWLTVASQYCVHCQQNVVADLVLGAPVFRRYAVPRAPNAASPVPVTASYVRLLITWSSAGGIGGCDDTCDWACNINSFGVFSPGALPPAGLVTPPPPSTAHRPYVACPDVSYLVEQHADIDAGGVVLTGGAVLQPPGSGAHGSTAIRLTEALPLRRGAAEYTRIVRPLEECHTCTDVHDLTVSIHVWLGGARGLPGEGLAVSLVDADRQTPGATRFVQVGCGASLALPLHALSIVLDTAENDGDASCSGAVHGTGVHLVSTLGAGAAPVVLRSTLDTSTSSFRAAEWLPLEFTVRRQAWVGHGQQSAVGSLGAGPLVPDSININGTEVLTGLLATGQLDAFYVVASALTSARGADAHLVSMLHVRCQLSSLHLEPENWAGNRQPFTPPSMHRPPLATSQAHAADERSTPAAAAAFFAAFGITTAMLGAAAAASRLRRSLRAGTPAPAADEASSGGAEPDKLASHASFALAIDAGEADAQGFDVFLSYRRADYRLADAVHDKLRLATALRVFKDVDGRIVGTRFGAELVRMVRSAPVFAPLVSLASLQRMAGAAAPDADVDACLAEWVAALHFRAAGRVRLIHPLLASEPPPPAQAASPSPPRLESLAQDPRYAAALAALPDAAPAATMQAVAAALRAIGDAPLAPAVAEMSVRDIVAGAAGVLAGTVLAVDCAPDDLGLYIRSRYAPPMLRVAEEARACASAAGSCRTSLP